MPTYNDPVNVLRVEVVVRLGAHSVKSIANKTRLSEEEIRVCLQALKRSGKVKHGWFSPKSSSGSSGNRGV